MFVALACENCFDLACDEGVLLFVDGDALVGEDGYIAIIGHFSNTHEQSWEIIECLTRPTNPSGKLNVCYSTGLP